MLLLFPTKVIPPPCTQGSSCTWVVYDRRPVLDCKIRENNWNCQIIKGKKKSSTPEKVVQSRKRIINLLPQWFTFPTTREPHCNNIYIREVRKECINLCLHIVLRRYPIQEILDDAKIEVYTECISRKRNPPSCHTIWHHWPDCILFVPHTGMMATRVSSQSDYRKP